MKIKPIDTIIDADRVLDLVGKDFNFDHAKGIAELLKNSVDAYNIENTPDEEQIVIISVKTGSRDYVKQIEVIDFCGMTKEKIDKGFVYWFSNVAATITKEGTKSNIRTFGGHGNGGKFYMRQMFKEAFLITYSNGYFNIFGFDENKRYGYNESYKNKKVEPFEALKLADLVEKDIPDKILNRILDGKNGFTVIRGTNPIKTKDTNYRIKLAEKIVSNPQAQRLIKHKNIFFQSLPDPTWIQLTVPKIKPKEGFEESFEYICPDTIEVFGTTVQMINPKYPNSILLKLMTSEKPLTGINQRDLNRIDFLGEIGVIASYHLSEIGLFSSGYIEFIYGECYSPIMEDDEDSYVKNDRVEFVRGERSEAIQKWIQECVSDLAKKIEEKQKKQRRAKDLKDTSNFNKILNTWNHQFIKAMLKEQLFGYDDRAGIGGSDEESAIIGKNKKKESGKKATKSKGTKGGTETRKAPQYARILISSHDPDPLSEDGSTFDCDPRQPAVHQRPVDVAHGIYWINTSKPLADLILRREGAGSSRWRFYLFQRHVDIIIKESIFQMGKTEVSLNPDDVTKKIEDIISDVHDKASEDLVSFLFDDDYKI